MIIGGLLLAEAGRGKSQGSSNKRKGGRGQGRGAGASSGGGYFHGQLMVVMSVHLNYVSHNEVDDLRGKAC